MFSFLSRGWRQQSSGVDEADNSTSNNLSLPWPVTEGSTKKKVSSSQGQLSTGAGREMNISQPIPRTIPNSLTGLNSPTATKPPTRAIIGDPVEDLPPFASSAPAQQFWLEEAAARRKAKKLEDPHNGRPDSRTGFYPPPEVVRLDSNDPNNEEPTSNETTDGHIIYPDSHAHTTYGLYAHDPQHKYHRGDMEYDTDGHDHDFYTSPFDSSDESVDIHSQAFPSPPTTIPSPKPGQRWPNLKVHTNSTFSRSTQSLQRGQETHVINPPNHPLEPTDLYGYAYNYPLVKQLSPIIEQDYISPASAKSGGSRLFGSRKGSTSTVSPAAGSVYRLAAVSGIKGPGPSAFAADLDKEISRPGSRTGSVSSGKTPTGASLSRAGSMSMKDGNLSGNSQNPSPGDSTPSETVPRPSPVYNSPFLTRHLNRTHSQTSSKSDSQGQGQQGPRSHISAPPSRQSTASSNPASNPPSRSNTAEINVQTPTSAGTSATHTLFTPVSTIIQSPTSPNSNAPTIHAPSPAVTTLPAPIIPPLDFRPFFPGPHHTASSRGSDSSVLRPSRDPMGKKKRGGVDKMPRIEGSVEGYYEEPYEYEEEEEEELPDDYPSDEDDEAYELESVHAESFVTASTHDEPAGPSHKPKLGIATSGSAKGSIGKPSDASSNRSQPASNVSESFITRRWERSAAIPSSPMVSPTTLRSKNHQRLWPARKGGRLALLTPAFWSFWCGFLFPILWLIGGWHFTNCGEQPPKYTFWEWYFWNRHWTWVLFKQRVRKMFGCMPEKDSDTEGSHQTPMDQKRRQRKPGARPTSFSQGTLRAGKVYPALPRWVAEKQSSDDGRARLNDMKRSLKGISFGYPFIPRLPGSLASNEAASASAPPSPMGRLGHAVWNIFCSPNRVLDQLYGVKITEVRGRPESGRRMIDPWIQRCRYAFCYGLLLVAAGLCIGSAYLIVRNTRQL